MVVGFDNASLPCLITFTCICSYLLVEGEESYEAAQNTSSGQ